MLGGFGQVHKLFAVFQARFQKGKIVFSLMINNYHGPYKQMKENTGALLESFAEIK